MPKQIRFNYTFHKNPERESLGVVHYGTRNAFHINKEIISKVKNARGQALLSIQFARGLPLEKVINEHAAVWGMSPTEVKKIYYAALAEAKKVAFVNALPPRDVQARSRTRARRKKWILVRFVLGQKSKEIAEGYGLNQGYVSTIIKTAKRRTPSLLKKLEEQYANPAKRKLAEIKETPAKDFVKMLVPSSHNGDYFVTPTILGAKVADKRIEKINSMLESIREELTGKPVSEALIARKRINALENERATYTDYKKGALLLLKLDRIVSTKKAPVPQQAELRY